MKKEKKIKYEWEKDFKECDFDSKEEFLWIYVLGGCGCGSYDENIKNAWKVFELFATPFDDRRFSVYDKPEYEIIAHWLDSKNLIEHGTSIAGSWLTEEGEKLYYLLKNLNKPMKNQKKPKGKCIVCGKLTSHKGRFIDDPKDKVGYREWCCKDCWEKIAEENL